MAAMVSARGSSVVSAAANPTAAPQPVDDPPPGDRDQPGAERPVWIVGVAHRVERQEDVLHTSSRSPDRARCRAASERR